MSSTRIWCEYVFDVLVTFEHVPHNGHTTVTIDGEEPFTVIADSFEEVRETVSERVRDLFPVAGDDEFALDVLFAE